MCERKHERRRWRHRGNFPLFVACLFIVLTQNLYLKATSTILFDRIHIFCHGGSQISRQQPIETPKLSVTEQLGKNRVFSSTSVCTRRTSMDYDDYDVSIEKL